MSLLRGSRGLGYAIEIKGFETPPLSLQLAKRHRAECTLSCFESVSIFLVIDRYDHARPSGGDFDSAIHFLGKAPQNSSITF